MEERGSTTLKRRGQRQEWMETMTVLSRVVQTLLLGLFLPVPVLDSVQVGTTDGLSQGGYQLAERRVYPVEGWPPGEQR